MSSKGVNKAILVGNLGDDPEVRNLPSGAAAARLSIATSEQRKDKNTGESKEHTEWHRVVAFGKLAEIVGQYLTKGAKIYVEGKIKTRKWQDSAGTDRYTTEIVAAEIQFLDSKGSGGSQYQKEVPEAQGGHPQNPPPVTQPDFDDDIPF